MAITLNTPQAFTAALASALAAALPEWLVVSDISQDRDTPNKYICLHVADTNPVNGLPADNYTMRVGLEVIAMWSGGADMDDDVLTAQFFAEVDNLIASLSYKDFPSTVSEEAVPGWVIIDYNRAFPVVSTDGIFYQVTARLDLIVQF